MYFKINLHFPCYKFALEGSEFNCTALSRYFPHYALRTKQPFHAFVDSRPHVFTARSVKMNLTTFNIYIKKGFFTLEKESKFIPPPCVFAFCATWEAFPKDKRKIYSLCFASTR